MKILELKSTDTTDFETELKAISDEDWEASGLVYGPTELKGMYQIYRDTRNLSRSKMVNYQELYNLKQAYKHDLAL